MSNLQIKTDNTYLKNKIKLRINHLPEKEEIKVLDCFAGNQIIWGKIKKRINKKFTIIGIDKSRNKKGLRGDNLKYIKGMDLNRFDIIDLDAYGVPYKQIKMIFEKNYKGRIFITFIQSMFGELPKDMLKEIGYSEEMIKKCPTLFNRNGIEKFKGYLSKLGVIKINRITIKNKHYIYIDNNRHK
jgi:hypothetical protein